MNTLTNTTPHQGRCTCGMCAPSSEMTANGRSSSDERWFGSGRTKFIIDLENICGGPGQSDDIWAIAWKALVETFSVSAGDEVLIGLSNWSLKRHMTCLPWGEFQVVVGSGPNGADHALIDAVDIGFDATRFDNVVIASGDHAFTDVAKLFHRRYVKTINATSNLAGSSWQLSTMCDLHVNLKLKHQAGRHA